MRNIVTKKDIMKPIFNIAEKIIAYKELAS